MISIDYHAELKIIEIEYTGGKLYHYPGIDEKVWATFLQFVNVGSGLGTYINLDFKKMIDDNDYDYYELTLLPA